MELFNYLLKVSACSVLFFAFYLVVLRKLTFFKINRFYLLGSLLMSFIIPSMQFTIEREIEYTPVSNEPIVYDVESLQTSTGVEVPQVTYTPPLNYEVVPFNWVLFLPYLYGGIVVSLLLLSIWRVIHLLKHTTKSVKEINGLKLISKEFGFTNCSFFNYVFIDENSLTEAEFAVLLAHEEVHAKQYHSIDKLLLMVAKAILWFNPIIYLYDKALEEAHEYEADDTTSQQIGTGSYASLLLKLAVRKSAHPLIHNFVKSPIKERIRMLFNSKSKNMKKLVYLLALPIGLGLIWGFTIDVVEVLPNSQEKEFTLVIDAGHGGKDKGTVVNGISEKEIALSMSKRLKKLAEENGIKVITTRNTDSYTSLEERAKADGSFIISLHVNSQPKGNDRNGVEMFIPSSSSDKIKLLRSANMTYSLYQTMKDLKGIMISNKPRQTRLYLLENSKLPGVVLELGFLTNKNDYQYLINDKKQEEMAKAIVSGIINFKKNSKSDQELKAVVEEANRNGEAYVAWTKSAKYKTIQDKAAKIKSKIIKGNIEALHYFSVRNVLDGFILNADGERYRVYLTKDQLNQVYLGIGDPISVKANYVDVWQDSDYPVIRTLEIFSKNKPESSHTKTVQKPKILSADSIRINNSTRITTLKKALIELLGGKLEAEDVEMDSEMEMIKAKGAKYTREKGYLIKSDLMVFDMKKGTFTVNNHTSKTQPSSAAFNLFSKLNFLKSDSIKVSKIMDNAIILTGKVKMKIDNYLINAKVVTANKDSNVITAYFGSLTNGNESTLKAEMIEFDLITKDIKYGKYSGLNGSFH